MCIYGTGVGCALGWAKKIKSDLMELHMQPKMPIGTLITHTKFGEISSSQKASHGLFLLGIITT